MFLLIFLSVSQPVMRSVEMSHIPTIDNVLMDSVPYKMYPTNKFYPIAYSEYESGSYRSTSQRNAIRIEWRSAGGPIVARWVLAKVRDQDCPRAGFSFELLNA